jgi:hypothetical protein
LGRSYKDFREIVEDGGNGDKRECPTQTEVVEKDEQNSNIDQRGYEHTRSEFTFVEQKKSRSSNHELDFITRYSSVSL